MVRKDLCLNVARCGLNSIANEVMNEFDEVTSKNFIHFQTTSITHCVGKLVFRQNFLFEMFHVYYISLENHAILAHFFLLLVASFRFLFRRVHFIKSWCLHAVDNEILT